MKMPIRMWLARQRASSRATMKMEMVNLAATVVQYTQRHTHELDMKNNVVRDSQPWVWKRTRESSF